MTPPSPWTPKRHEAAQARCEAATPGPWGYDYQERHVSGRPKFVLRGPVSGASSPHAEPWLADLRADAHAIHLANPTTDDQVDMARELADAKLIAHSRTDLPDALEAIASARAALELIADKGCSGVLPEGVEGTCVDYYGAAQRSAWCGGCLAGAWVEAHGRR